MIALERERLRRVDDARAERQREPLSLATAQVGRDGLLEHRGLDRLREAFVGQVEEVPEVHGHQDVSGRLRPFGGDPLGQPVLDEDRIDLDAGGLGERVEERLNQSRFTRGVQVDFLRGRQWQRSSIAQTSAEQRTNRELPIIERDIMSVYSLATRRQTSMRRRCGNTNRCDGSTSTRESSPTANARLVGDPARPAGGQRRAAVLR